ncbi:MAG: hypothetical protein KDI92_00170 [Xanthomonadales bacterium]|nr:hypothetical protein [Xanthomonadales bacterium]
MNILMYLLALLGLLLVVICWQQAQKLGRQQRTTLRLSLVVVSLILGWLSFIAFQENEGTEFAWFFMLFHFSWLAWILLASKAHVKFNDKTVKTVKSVAAEHNWLYKSSILLLAGPVALFSSILIALCISKLFIAELANQWVLTFIIMPIIWGALATWFAADEKRLRPLLITLLLTAVCYGWLL